MPVDTKHRTYRSKLKRWVKNRDAFGGEDTVKDKGQVYLTKPSGFEETDYTRYVMNAKFHGATARTVKGLTGTIFQKEPILTVSTAFEKHMPDITLTDISVGLISETVVADVQLMGRYGILVDWDEDEMRPYWSGYPAESIINWQISRVNGSNVLSLLVTKEEADKPTDDMFESELITRYRVCFLDEQGTYQVHIYESIGEKQQGDSLTRTDTYTPMRRGQSLDFIPFQFFNSDSLTPAVSKGPLDDLVDTNYAYYRHSADYEHGLYMTALPTAVLTGTNYEGDLRVGSLTAWVIPEPEAKAYYMEFSGSGLETHAKAMEVDKNEMATLGARLLEERPETAETLGAVQLRHSGELGSLKSMSMLISEGLTNVIRMHHWWNGDTENIADERFSITLNTDFDIAKLTPQEILARITAWQEGTISYETLFWNFQQGEIVPDDRTAEQERALIDTQPPARMPFGDEPDDIPNQPDDDDESDEDEEDEAA